MKTIIVKVTARESKIGYALILAVIAVSYALSACFNCL